MHKITYDYNRQAHFKWDLNVTPVLFCQPSGPADDFLGSVTQHPSITLKGASCGPAPPTGTVYQAIKVTTMKTNM